MTDIAKIAADLNEFERERLIGWKGPGGAAYNAVSEALQERGLLNRDWSLSGMGKEVVLHLAHA